ncbi:sperm microtubule associated protein 2-like [Lineus longissimus]|uniref:sperm microtubule associated protein 2-like n=1 Tax=Lineus longissimus TaxID=88925 RepID=UPI00315D7D99
MAATGSSKHVAQLARPKPLPPGFITDRRSVYWIDKHPPTPGADGTTAFTLTPRQEQLANYKACNSGYQGDKPSPQWTVGQGAQSATASARVEQLAMARPVNSHYQYERNVYTIVPDSALNATASVRLEQLAQPKKHHLLPIIDPKQWDWSDWEDRVSGAAKKAVATPYLENLAMSKMPHSLYQGQRPVQWNVQDTAKKASASFRVVQLSRPRSRGTINDDYDPYKVTMAAKHAMATPRITELCAPIPRKIRQKKV